MSYMIKIVLMWFCFASTVEGMSHKIDRAFKLIFWGAEFGVFRVEGEIVDNEYIVSTNASGNSIISLFSKYEISSGAFGSIDNRGKLIPIHSLSRWSNRGNSKQTKLSYQDGNLTGFESSPDLNKEYHIQNPIGIGNTIDPVSLVVWLLLKRKEPQLCQDKLMILDGFRMSELIFENKKILKNSIVCLGVIKRVDGFKGSDFNKKNLKFKIMYSPTDADRFEVSNVEIQTIFGKIILM